MEETCLGFREWENTKEEWSHTSPEKRNCWAIYREGYQSAKNLRGIKWRNEDDGPLIFAAFYSNRRIRNSLTAHSVRHFGATGAPGFEQRKRDCFLSESFLWFLWGLEAEKGCRARWGWSPAPRLRPDNFVCLGSITFVHSFIEQIFTETLLCVRHHVPYCRLYRKQAKSIPSWIIL